jgi:putative ABC transport system permease protein
VKFSRNLLLSCELLAAHRLRTFLSILGIVVGVGAVVLAVSAGQGAGRSILERIRAMGTNLIVVNAGRWRMFADRQKQVAIATTLIPADAQAIADECPSVVLTAPSTRKKIQATWESEHVNTTVVGLTPDGFQIKNIQLADGDIFDPEQSRARRRLAVLGPTVVTNLFNGENPLGLRFRIDRVPFEVIGVTSPKGMDINGSDQDDVIIIPLETAMRRLVNVAHVDRIFVQARGPEVMEQAEQEISQLLRERHQLRGPPDDFTIQNQATLIKTERELNRSLTLLIASVAGISLLVGGVGILAVMLISVKERTREIGLRRAIGASRRDIRNQFLAESVLLAAAGGICGIAVAVGAIYGLSALGYWDAIVSWPAATVSLVFSVSVGLIFGIYPALRAARLEPIEALRAE